MAWRSLGRSMWTCTSHRLDLPFRKIRGQPGDSDCEEKSGKGKKFIQHPQEFCFNFHNGKKCGGCDFKHTCYQCEGKHAVSKCEKKKDKPEQRSTICQGTKYIR